MANEFVARKGIIALSDSQVTGSLDVSQNVQAVGTLGGALFQNPQTITGTFLLPENYNALFIGPVTVQDTITVSSGTNLRVI